MTRTRATGHKLTSNQEIEHLDVKLYPNRSQLHSALPLLSPTTTSRHVLEFEDFSKSARGTKLKLAENDQSVSVATAAQEFRSPNL